MTTTSSTTSPTGSLVSTSPAPARTDLTERAPVGDGAGSQPMPGRTVSSSTARRLALPLVLGALSWSVSSFTLGFNPDSSWGITIQDLTGFAFQVGVMSLVVLQLRTAATGLGRGARVMLRVEQVLLSLAMIWSVVHGLVPSARDELWLAVLDVFWPLSMLGMFVIAIKIAVAGRWHGLARWWPLVAESWAVVTVPAMGIGGATVGQYVGAIHLLVGYATLGLVIIARPHLVGARD